MVIGQRVLFQPSSFTGNNVIMFRSFGIDSLITAAADLFTSKTREETAWWAAACIDASLDKVYTIPDMQYILDVGFIRSKCVYIIANRIIRRFSPSSHFISAGLFLRFIPPVRLMDKSEWFHHVLNIYMCTVVVVVCGGTQRSNVWSFLHFLPVGLFLTTPEKGKSISADCN